MMIELFLCFNITNLEILKTQRVSHQDILYSSIKIEFFISLSLFEICYRPTNQSASRPTSRPTKQSKTDERVHGEATIPKKSQPLKSPQNESETTKKIVGPFFSNVIEHFCYQLLPSLPRILSPSVTPIACIRIVMSVYADIIRICEQYVEIQVELFNETNTENVLHRQITN